MSIPYITKQIASPDQWVKLNRIRSHGPGDMSDIINPENYIRRSLLVTRYLLFILTSAFYLADTPSTPVHIKMMVFLSFLAATILAQNLYDSWDIKTLHQNNRRDLESESTYTQRERVIPLKLIAAETIGVAFLILPTGGLDSHFVWYALNPIIAAVVYLPGLFCWGTLGLFLCTAIGASMIYPGFTGSPMRFISNHLSILLVFFVSTSLAQVAISLSKRLGTAYTWLALAHEATEQSLQHISSLYEALEAFSTREDRAQLVDVLAYYASKLCGESAACFLKQGAEYGEQETSDAILRIASQDGLDHDLDWEKEMRRLWNRMKADEEIMVQPLEEATAQVIAVPVISQGECFGLLAYLQSPGAVKHQAEKQRALTFLAGVAGIILERLKTDKLWARLLVSEEQNRIANEIHDGVSQYLFSMVCALDTITKEDAHLQDERIQEQLNLVEETANRAARELRASIYKLSPHKRGESIFVDNLASYLDDLGRLNSIQVDLQAEGSEEVLSSALRKALYRIVREASSNAIRHGKCSCLKVGLSMLPNQTILEIKDNGCGYKKANTNSSNSWRNGLGNWNMYHLAQCFNGELEIQSEPGRGTLVRFTIPKKCETGDRLKEAASK